MALDPYPNPAKSQIKLPLILPEDTSVEISILDIVGKQCGALSTGMLHNGFNEVPLNTEQLSPGIYIIQCKAAGAIITKKIIIQ
jgi:hypothetical protein